MINFLVKKKSIHLFSEWKDVHVGKYINDFWSTKEGFYLYNTTSFSAIQTLILKMNIAKILWDIYRASNF